MNDQYDSIKGYNGNQNLKGKGAQIEYTPDMIKEYVKCANDPIYFAEKYIKIVHVDHGLIPIKMYDFQKEIVNATTNNRRVTVNTSRQAGKTTTAVCVILHYVLFQEHKTVALLANKGDAAREILDRIKIAYEALPKWLQQGVVEWNKGSVEFENGCKIIAAATSSSNIRGKSISYLYIDEAAFVEGWDEFFASVFPTITSGKTTKILFTSTPNGLNHFHKTCVGGKEGKNGYIYIEVPWYKVPGRDEAWKKDTVEGLDGDMQKFAQEFECEFMGSSGTLIIGSKLKALRDINPIHQLEGMCVYKQPELGHVYILTADVSRGKGLDYSAFQVIDVTQMPYQQVATFNDNMITPIDYAGIIHQTMTRYNEAFVLIEVNDIGGQVADILHFDYEAESVLYTESAGRLGKRISGGFGSNVDRGIRTTKSVKAIGCNMVKMLVEQDQLNIVDEKTINELKTFSRKGTSFEAESGCHDDMVMGLVLFGWLSDQAFFRELTDINTMAKLKERNEEEMMQNLMPIGFNSEDLMPTEDDNSWATGNHSIDW